VFQSFGRDDEPMVEEPAQRRLNFGFMTPIASNPTTEKHTTAV